MTNRNLNDALEKANQPDHASTEALKTDQPDQTSTEDLGIEDLSDEDLDDVAGGCQVQGNTACGSKNKAY